MDKRQSFFARDSEFHAGCSSDERTLLLMKLKALCSVVFGFASDGQPA